jgi:hypothetical protein
MKRLGEILLERGAVAVAELHTALEACHRSGGRLGSQLLNFGFVTEKQLLEALSEQSGFAAVPRSVLKNASPRARQLIPLAVARRLQAVPFERMQRQLQVAMVNPRDEVAREEIRTLTGLMVEPYVAVEAAVEAALEILASDVSAEEMEEAATTPPPAALEVDVWSREIPGPEWLAGYRPEGRIAPSAQVRWATYPGLTPVADPNRVSVDSGLDRTEFERALNAASHRDEVGQALLDYAFHYFSRMILFSVHKERISGWLVAGSGPVLEDVQSLDVAFDEPSVFVNVSAQERAHQGPLPPGTVNASVAAALGDPPATEVVVQPVRLKDRPVAYLVGDLPGEGVANVPLADLARAASGAALALEMLIIRRKITVALEG